MSNEKPNYPKLLQDNLLQMKKMTSQIKGEHNDALTEAIAKNFENFNSMGISLTNEIAQREGKIVELEKELDDVYTAHPELKIAKEKKDKIPAQTKKQ